MAEDLKLTEEDIAFVAHEANRALQALFGDDMPSLPWLWEGRGLRESTVAGVRRVLAGITPEENHEMWRAFKANQGWRYGPEKDIELMTHPCMVDYDKLPRSDRVKVKMFYAIVRTLAEEM